MKNHVPERQLGEHESEQTAPSVLLGGLVGSLRTKVAGLFKRGPEQVPAADERIEIADEEAILKMVEGMMGKFSYSQRAAIKKMNLSPVIHEICTRVESGENPDLLDVVDTIGSKHVPKDVMDRVADSESTEELLDTLHRNAGNVVRNLNDVQTHLTSLRRLKPIRNEEPRIGRNDPCPCGSGKKYKKCCGVVNASGQKTELDAQ